jgi:predicted regulator of Ras-like GTPase activity (Roadblock/LC7/MglB family)
MANLRDYLGRFLAVPGVRAVVLVGRDGLWMDAAGRGDQRLFEALGALGASALGTADALGQDIGGGATIGAVLEYATALVSVDPLGEHAAFVTLCESAASLGRVRHTAYSLREDVLRALDAQ